MYKSRKYFFKKIIFVTMFSLFFVVLLTLLVVMIIRVIFVNESTFNTWADIVNCIISGLSLIATSLTTIIAFKINSGILSNARLSNSGSIQIMSVFVDGKRGFKIKNYGGGPCQIERISVIYENEIISDTNFLELIKRKCPSINSKQIYYTDSINGRIISADESLFLFSYIGNNYISIKELNEAMSKINDICVLYNSYVDNDEKIAICKGFSKIDLRSEEVGKNDGLKKSLFLNYLISENPTGLTKRENDILDIINELHGRISEVQAGDREIEQKELKSLEELGFLYKENSVFYFEN